MSCCITWRDCAEEPCSIQGLGISFPSQIFHMENANNNSCSPNPWLKFIGRIESKDINDKALHKYKRITFRGLKKSLVKALCILFSNLKFKIQWKSASNSWLKGDIIRKNTWSHEASGILIFAFALARRENQVPHPAWVFVLCGRGDRMAKRQGPWSPSWNATCLLQAPPSQPTHHRPWGGSSPLHFVSQKLEDGPGNRDLLGQGRKWKYTLGALKKILQNTSLFC